MICILFYRYLLENGFHFVLTRRFNSDPVEQLISSIRASSGSSDATTAVAALYSLERTLKLGLISSSKHANVKVGEEITEIFRSGKLAEDNVMINNEFENVVVEKLYEVTFPNGKVFSPENSLIITPKRFTQLTPF